MDDDNYVNVRALLRLLASYPHTQDVYIGKPSLDRPIQATERVSENKMVSVPPSCAGARWEETKGLPRAWVSPRSPPAAPCPLLVCHWRGWLLHQPWAGPEDEPVGQVSALGTRVSLPWVPRSSQQWVSPASHAQAGSHDPPPTTGHFLPARPRYHGTPLCTHLVTLSDQTGSGEGAARGLWGVGWGRAAGLPAGTQQWPACCPAGGNVPLLCPGLGSAWLTGPALSSCSGGHFMSTAERIRLPDDCTIGYIVEALLGVPLIRSGLFHSHLENLQQVPASELHEQVRVPGQGRKGKIRQRRNEAVWGQAGVTVFSSQERPHCWHSSDTSPRPQDPAPILGYSVP